jgi:signal peptidase I
MASLASVTNGARRRPAVALLAVVAAACLVMLALLYGAGYRPLVVASASMAPAVDTGDLIITRAVAPGAVAVGDVVSFHDHSREGRLVTHRVMATHREGRRTALVTRGDVNSGVERWSAAADARVGTLALRIPRAGYAVTWVTRLPIILGLLAIVMLAFVRAVSAARGTRRAARRISGSALAALASAATIVSVPIMLAATEGAFSAVTANVANSFEAADNFCPDTTLIATGDTSLIEASPSDNTGNDGQLLVQSKSLENYRTLVRFALPVTPVGCTRTSAHLRLSLLVGFLGGGRTLLARHVTESWAENTATWANQPNTDASNPASMGPTTTSGTHVINVTGQVNAWTALTNNGFLIRDSVENSSGTLIYYSSEAGDILNRPTLVIAYTPS